MTPAIPDPREASHLPAGRLLDAAVHQHVFGIAVLGLAPARPWRDAEGWHVETLDPEGATEQPVFLGERCICDDYYPEVDGPKVLGHAWQCLEVVPFYSDPADLNPAWSVLTFLRAQGVRCGGVDFANDVWYVCLTTNDGEGVSGVAAEALTPQLAICRCALVLKSRSG